MPNEEGSPGNGRRPDLEIEAATIHSPQLVFPPGHPTGHQGPVLPHSAHEDIASVENLTASQPVLMPSSYNTPSSPGLGGASSNESQHLATSPHGVTPFAARNAQDPEELETEGIGAYQEPNYETLHHSESFPDSLSTTGELSLPTPPSSEISVTPQDIHTLTDHHQSTSALPPALLAVLQARVNETMAADDALFAIDYDEEPALDPPSHDLLNTGNNGDADMSSTPIFETPTASEFSLAPDANTFPDFTTNFMTTHAAWQAQNGGPGIFGLPEDDSFESADIYPTAGEDFDPRNSNFCKFLREWSCYYEAGAEGFPHINPRPLLLSTSRVINTNWRENLAGDFNDFQRIDWHSLETTRRDARRVRRALYQNYPDVGRAVDSMWAKSIPNTESYFQFRSFDISQRPRLSHFQLRHNLSATSSRDVFYAGCSQVCHAGCSQVLHAGSCKRPEQTRCVMDLSQPDVDSFNPGESIKICSLSATHGVLIAGGFGGEYALKNLSSEFSSSHTEGIVTDHENGITNHISTILGRSNTHPHAVFSSNDNFVRTLDCYTGKMVKKHEYPWPVNCTATSPDGRLRVVVGDTTSVMIDDAETGSHLVRLGGHQDHGFSCAWADDGITVATANQDMQVMIFDARWWQRPLAVIWAEQAGVRSLHFSPVGGGKRVLLMAEPADIVSIVDAETFETKQDLDMFGEISGAGFSPDGSKFFVANADARVGGIAEYERVGYGEDYDIRYLQRRDFEDREDECGPEKYHDWVSDTELEFDCRVLQSESTRRRRGLGLDEVVI